MSYSACYVIVFSRKNYLCGSCKDDVLPVFKDILGDVRPVGCAYKYFTGSFLLTVLDGLEINSAKLLDAVVKDLCRPLFKACGVFGDNYIIVSNIQVIQKNIREPCSGTFFSGVCRQSACS